MHILLRGKIPLVKYFSAHFSGREIFVGISKRTNVLGAQAVARAFPEFSTTMVQVHAPAVHLKDYISMAGPEIMAISKSPHAQKTFAVSITFVYFGCVLCIPNVNVNCVCCVFAKPIYHVVNRVD